MVDKQKLEQAKAFLETLPEIEFCVGYGSGFVKQLGYEKLNPQRDILIGVNDAYMFHLENIKKNPNFYSFTEKIYYIFLPFMHNIGAELNFIPYQKHDGITYKVGVFNIKYLEKALTIDKDGYLSGRLAKKVEHIKVSDEHNELIKYNRKCATIIALLLSENNIKKYDLLKTIIGLSYRGDWRKYLGLEKKTKIDNSLKGSYDEISSLYTDDDLYTEDCFERVTINSNVNNMIDLLQKDLLDYLEKNDYKNKNYENRKTILERYLFKKNFLVTPVQGIKGVVSVGPVKLIRYVYDKISKKFKK